MNNGKEDPMNSDETEADGVMYKKSRGYYYNPLLYYKRNLDKTFYYQYFKPYSHDHRMLMGDEDCQCPRGRLHDSKCPWYNPDVIYILDKKGDLSISEQSCTTENVPDVPEYPKQPTRKLWLWNSSCNCLYGT